jgi:glycosyltransferase involved in cell wall biosynthesis
VTVNGSWPDQPKHIFSLYNPCLSEQELKEVREIASGKKLSTPINLLYVGRLETPKGVGFILEIVAALRDREIKLHLEMIGDGPERKHFETKATVLGVAKLVRFHGWLPKHDLADFYGKAHFLLLPSKNEGFPKVVSEAMAFGVVPVVSAVSSIPEVIKTAASGYSISSGNSADYVKIISYLIKNPDKWEMMSENGKKFSKFFTYEFYIESLKNMLAC